ncbi:hypothetical protein CBR_g12204 [Chara braunii]|uniref:Uncharacterized protein n=1 Tax=Chara braunii TaxID=69332 RepID=A0A388KRD4_CHABU|nr:hypothetical protein CBR_g12204 [Chara braunii]|eukprot:GBG72630.1 hypothetical protein CBR_g12204 [Chara braunii]
MSQVQDKTKAGSKTGHPVDPEASREELAEKAKKGDTVIHGGTGGKTLEKQEALAEGRSRGGRNEDTPIGE